MASRRNILSKTVDAALYHAETALLFTWTDYKTIFLPITLFACATAPLDSIFPLLKACSWIWLHLLMCNVSNQARSAEEDKLNRPWRPVAAGRLTEAQAVQLRWATVAGCILLSYLYLGIDLIWPTLGLVFTTFMYDEMGLAAHVVGKNFCNIGGYTTFEIGATKLMGSTHSLDNVSRVAVLLSGTLIFTTIQAQDFPDVVGDAKLGRITFPIYAPEFSRAFTIFAVIAWSVFLSWFWKVDAGPNFALVALGTYVGLRYYVYRKDKDDKLSYRVFNIWLMLAHLLPWKTRMAGEIPQMTVHI